MLHFVADVLTRDNTTIRERKIQIGNFLVLVQISFVIKNMNWSGGEKGLRVSVCILKSGVCRQRRLDLANIREDEIATTTNNNNKLLSNSNLCVLMQTAHFRAKETQKV